MLFTFVFIAGWWFASYDGKEGWVPSSFLEPEDASMALQLDKMDAVQLTEESPTGKQCTHGLGYLLHVAHHLLGLQVGAESPVK